MRKNFWIKVASVVLAVAMWLFVISRGQSEVSIEVPIEFRNIPKGLQIVKAETTTVAAVGIKGHERFLKNMTPADIHIYLDLSNITEGRHLLNINSDNVKLPPPLRLININPSSVRVTVEKVLKEKEQE
jgi:YbbR domain-containing protein